MELALDLADGDNGFRFFGRGGGFQRRCRAVHAILAGNGDGDDSELLSCAQPVTTGNRDPLGDGIA